MHEQIRLRDLPVGSKLMLPCVREPYEVGLPEPLLGYVWVRGTLPRLLSGALLVIKRSRGVYVML